MPHQGEVSAGVEGAPNVDAGKQGKHVHGHKNSENDKSHWKDGENGVELTQKGWLNGESLSDGSKVWNTGEVVGDNGEMGVRVHQDSKGRIHGYPVQAGRYLK